MESRSNRYLDIRELKKQLLPVLRRHQVSRAAIFGSTARGTARKTSDLDLLIEFKGNKSLLDLVALKQDLEATINRKVDVQTYRALHPLIKKSVLEQEIKVL